MFSSEVNCSLLLCFESFVVNCFFLSTPVLLFFLASTDTDSNFLKSLLIPRSMLN